MPKIYTRTGDDGSTGLIGPGRVSKSAPRVEAYGSVDELNATLGTVRALDGERWLAAELASIQSNLFRVGAELADPSDMTADRVTRTQDADVAQLEAWIDRLEKDLPALQSFIVPAGTALAAQMHMARTVCRRAERRLVALRREESVSPVLVRYLNRLADLLFVMARWCNRRAGAEEVEWHG